MDSSIQPGDPTRVGSYRVIGRLGAGGMGRVFLGMSPGGRKVAIKVINPECADSPQFRERFTREIDAARRVGGFHAAQVVDADPSADPPWMVTAYIEGPTLAEEVAQHGPMPAERVRELGAQLAEGLAAIHAVGLVHRDLKPGNVILASDGPRIIDFGIARPALSAGLTTTGMVIGTIAYMSPEQARGETVGPASDVFSLGAMLGFCLTGRSPLGSKPADLSAVDDEPLRDVITACLVASPVLRPSITAVLAALAPEGAIPEPRSVLADDGPEATEPDQAPIGGTLQHVPVIPPGPITPPRPDRQATGDGPRLPSRRAVLFTGLGTAAVAAVGVPVGLELSSGSGNGTPAASGSRTSSRGIQDGQPVLSKPAILQSGLHSGAKSVMFSPDGHVLASGNGDGTTTLWDADTRANLATLHRNANTSSQAATVTSATSQSVYGVAFSPDGTTLAAAHGDGTVALWNVASRTNIATLPGPGSVRGTSFAASVAFSPSGAILATSHDAATVSLWSVATRKIIATLAGTAGPWVYSLAFSPDGRLLATGSGDIPGAATSSPGVVEVWDVINQKVVATLAHTNTGPGALAFSGEKLANVQADGIVYVRTLTYARNLLTHSKPTVLANANSNAKSVAFRSDGKQLMTGNSDGTATIWDNTRQTVTKTLDTNTTAEVPSVAYRQGEPGLACGGENLVFWTYSDSS